MSRLQPFFAPLMGLWNSQGWCRHGWTFEQAIVKYDFSIGRRSEFHPTLSDVRKLPWESRCWKWQTCRKAQFTLATLVELNTSPPPGGTPSSPTTWCSPLYWKENGEERSKELGRVEYRDMISTAALPQLRKGRRVLLV